MTPCAFLILQPPFGRKEGNFSPLGATRNTKYTDCSPILRQRTAVRTRVQTLLTVELGCTHALNRGAKTGAMRNSRHRTDFLYSC